MDGKSMFHISEETSSLKDHVLTRKGRQKTYKDITSMKRGFLFDVFGVNGGAFR